MDYLSGQSHTAGERSIRRRSFRSPHEDSIGVQPVPRSLQGGRGVAVSPGRVGHAQACRCDTFHAAGLARIGRRTDPDGCRGVVYEAVLSAVWLAPVHPILREAAVEEHRIQLRSRFFTSNADSSNDAKGARGGYGGVRRPDEGRCVSRAWGAECDAVRSLGSAPFPILCPGADL